MARKAKFIRTGPSNLAKILSTLNSTPKLELKPTLKTLKLTLAFRNDHFGARHFVKEHLPSVRYANPTLDIQVEKARKAQHEAWRPEMELEFTDGSRQTLDLHEKWSTKIVKELMDKAGTASWHEWKATAAATGRPILPGEENEHLVKKRPTPIPLPSLKVYRANAPPKAGPTLIEKGQSTKSVLEEVKAMENTKKAVDVPIPPSRAKTGAAAVLP